MKPMSTINVFAYLFLGSPYAGVDPEAFGAYYGDKSGSGDSENDLAPLKPRGRRAPRKTPPPAPIYRPNSSTFFTCKWSANSCAIDSLLAGLVFYGPGAPGCPGDFPDLPSTAILDQMRDNLISATPKAAVRANSAARNDFREALVEFLRNANHIALTEDAHSQADDIEARAFLSPACIAGLLFGNMTDPALGLDDEKLTRLSALAGFEPFDLKPDKAQLVVDRGAPPPFRAIELTMQGSSRGVAAGHLDSVYEREFRWFGRDYEFAFAIEGITNFAARSSAETICTISHFRAHVLVPENDWGVSQGLYSVNAAARRPVDMTSDAETCAAAATVNDLLPAFNPKPSSGQKPMPCGYFPILLVYRIKSRSDRRPPADGEPIKKRSHGNVGPTPKIEKKP